MDKTITVVGSGIAYARPDAAVIEGDIVGTVGDYESAVKAAAEALTSLRKAIGDAGFDMDDLKTTCFSVDTLYNMENNRREFAGYSYRHGISIMTEADGDSLGKLLKAMTSCGDAPEFRVSYIVKDPTEPLAAARQAAVKDAKHRARELAEAAGVRIGDLVSIQYESVRGTVAPRGRMFAAMNVNAVPRDAEFHDSVTVCWQIL